MSADVTVSSSLLVTQLLLLPDATLVRLHDSLLFFIQRGDRETGGEMSPSFVGEIASNILPNFFCTRQKKAGGAFKTEDR